MSVPLLYFCSSFFLLSFLPVIVCIVYYYSKQFFLCVEICAAETFCRDLFCRLTLHSYAYTSTSPSTHATWLQYCKDVMKCKPENIFIDDLSGSVAQWLGRWTCGWRSRVQSQPLHCRVQLWTICSHTLSSASGVTTLWRYINQFKF